MRFLCSLIGTALAAVALSSAPSFVSAAGGCLWSSAAYSTGGIALSEFGASFVCSQNEWQLCVTNQNDGTVSCPAASPSSATPVVCTYAGHQFSAGGVTAMGDMEWHSCCDSGAGWNLCQINQGDGTVSCETC